MKYYSVIILIDNEYEIAKLIQAENKSIALLIANKLVNRLNGKLYKLEQTTKKSHPYSFTGDGISCFTSDYLNYIID